MEDTKNPDIDKDFALVLLVKEIMSQLDEFYWLRKNGAQGNISHALLREMCSVLPEMDEKMQERYLDILISTASQAEPPREVCHSEEVIAASVSPRRRTISAIANKLGLRAVSNG